MLNLSIRTIAIAIFSVCVTSVSAQNIFGKWRTIDRQTGEKKSIVEIYQKNGEVYGKIIDILNPGDKTALCEKCHGDEYNKPVLGMVLIKNMKKSGNYYKGGTILHPEHGKKFRCRLMLTKDPDILQVRGYVAFLYSTQYWERVR